MHPFSRKCDDGLLSTAAWNDLRSIHTRAKISILNRTASALLDEKSTYFFYVFGTLQKLASDFADFCEDLYDEVKDRVDRGIAAVPKESTYSLRAWV